MSICQKDETSELNLIVHEFDPKDNITVVVQFDQSFNSVWKIWIGWSGSNFLSLNSSGSPVS